MLGAIIGDVTGSRFEFSRAKPTKFELFSSECSFTDDTVCTVALMDWLANAEHKNSVTAREYLLKWVNKYPNAGYGSRFHDWMKSEYKQPYHSFGNGAAMRISPVAWVASCPQELESLVNAATSITHDHPEGMKGALTVATCIFMAIHGAKKHEIRKYAVSQYPEILDMDYERLVKTYYFNETCQGSVPQAIYCFLISDNYEDCIRKTISIGGDCDTTSAMSGAIAEAYWGIPENLTRVVRNYLDADMIKVIDKFYKHYADSPFNPVVLNRFKKAQEFSYESAYKELKNGRKESHWMWYIFPQIKGLGQSETSEYYSLTGIKETSLYYSDDTLGVRLEELCLLLLKKPNNDATEIFGELDAKKLQSCMTLFYIVTREKYFKEVLDKFFGGEFDTLTMKIMINQTFKY